MPWRSALKLSNTSWTDEQFLKVLTVSSIQSNHTNSCYLECKHSKGGQIYNALHRAIRARRKMTGGRKQRVILGGQVSDWCNILSGVPQGSVLGPLLFVIYINDIDEVVNSKLLKYADDTKIFNKVNSVEKVENLRTNLRSLVSWSKEWQMLFNLRKV